MSPEQLRASRDVDQRTDIWALGAILYELLTGSVPFPATTLTQLTAMVISDPPRPIESLREDVPAELCAVILKCLQKRAEDRFQTVADLAAALAPFGSATSVALATQRIPGALGSSSNSRLAAPADRPSFRAPGGSTDVAWDKTELAAGERRSKVVPIAVAVALASAILGAAVVVGVLHKRAAGPPVAPPPVSATATTPPLPTVRDPISPPVVSGVERPPPSSVVPQPTQTAAPIGTHHHVAGPPKHDAGAKPQGTAEGDLPSTRN